MNDIYEAYINKRTEIDVNQVRDRHEQNDKDRYRKSKIKPDSEKLNCFLLLLHILMKLQWFRYTENDYFSWLLLWKFPKLKKN